MEENKIEKEQIETKAQFVEKMVNEIVSELNLVHEGKYELEKAKRMAAISLTAQIELSQFLADAEADSKRAKVNVKSVEAECYFEHKEAADKKLSEAALQQYVARDSKMKNAEYNLIEAEREYKRWSQVFGVLKDSHIFFRGLGKNEWSM